MVCVGALRTHFAVYIAAAVRTIIDSGQAQLVRVPALWTTVTLVHIGLPRKMTSHVLSHGTFCAVGFVGRGETLAVAPRDARNASVLGNALRKIVVPAVIAFIANCPVHLRVVPTLWTHKAIALLVVLLLVIILADHAILAGGCGDDIRVVSLRALVAVRRLVVRNFMLALTDALGRRAAGLRGPSAGHESCHAFHFVIGQCPIPRHEKIHAPVRFLVRIIVDTNVLTVLIPTR